MRFSVLLHVYANLQQRRLFEVKSRLSVMVLECCQHCLTYVKYYYLLYYLLLGNPTCLILFMGHSYIVHF